MYSSTAEQRKRSAVQALAEKLYRQRYTYLLRIAVRNAAGEADAEEALQFAFRAFLEHFDPHGDAPPLAWLTLTFKRECWAKRKREHLDRRAGEQRADGSASPASLTDALHANIPDTAERVQRHLDAHERL